MSSQMPIVTPEQQEKRLPYLPGLDGLRALAVVAVLLYHADLTIAGGFLGVESFFVLSGYLITGLLLAEWRREGRVDLGAFWLRRARRLLPALFVMLVGTLALTSIALLLQPPMAALLAWALLGEALTVRQGIGGVIVLTGVYIAGRRAVPRARD